MGGMNGLIWNHNPRIIVILVGGEVVSDYIARRSIVYHHTAVHPLKNIVHDETSRDFPIKFQRVIGRPRAVVIAVVEIIVAYFLTKRIRNPEVIPSGIVAFDVLYPTISRQVHLDIASKTTIISMKLHVFQSGENPLSM